MAYRIPASKLRNCNDCGAEYDGTRGFGSSIAHGDDAVRFPFNGSTGVKAENLTWMHGAFCSDQCYDAAYAE